MATDYSKQLQLQKMRSMIGLHATTTASYYENTPMQYLESFSSLKIEILIEKKNDIFKINAQNIDCGYP